LVAAFNRKVTLVAASDHRVTFAVAFVA